MTPSGWMLQHQMKLRGTGAPQGLLTQSQIPTPHFTTRIRTQADSSSASMVLLRSSPTPLLLKFTHWRHGTNMMEVLIWYCYVMTISKNSCLMSLSLDITFLISKITQVNLTSCAWLTLPVVTTRRRTLSTMKRTPRMENFLQMRNDQQLQWCHEMKQDKNFYSTVGRIADYEIS